jgi:nucleoside-triphosphatase THEP1
MITKAGIIDAQIREGERRITITVIDLDSVDSI